MPHFAVQTFLLFPGSCHVTPPRNHSLAIPALAGIAGVFESSQRETKTQPRPISSAPDVSDEVETYTSDGTTDTFASPSSTSGTLYVFKNGVRQNFGPGGLGQVYMSGSNVVFRSQPSENEFISIFRQ